LGGDFFGLTEKGEKMVTEFCVCLEMSKRYAFRHGYDACGMKLFRFLPSQASQETRDTLASVPALIGNCGNRTYGWPKLSVSDEECAKFWVSSPEDGRVLSAEELKMLVRPVADENRKRREEEALRDACASAEVLKGRYREEKRLEIFEAAVSARGNKTQQERLADGSLPQKEAAKCVQEFIFSQFYSQVSGFTYPRYIRSSEAELCSECGAKFIVKDISDCCPVEVWPDYGAIKGHANLLNATQNFPGLPSGVSVNFSCRLRKHIGKKNFVNTCGHREFQAVRITRYSVRVLCELFWAGLSFKPEETVILSVSREYDVTLGKV